MNNYLKITTLFYLISTMTLCMYKPDPAGSIQLPFVNATEAYSFLVGSAEVKYKKLEPQEQKNLPVFIKYVNNNAIIKMRVIAYAKDDAGNEKKIASQSFFYQAPKGTFEAVNKIFIDLNKEYIVFGKPKVSISFEPKNLPIKAKKGL